MDGEPVVQVEKPRQYTSSLKETFDKRGLGRILPKDEEQTREFQEIKQRIRNLLGDKDAEVLPVTNDTGKKMILTLIPYTENVSVILAIERNAVENLQGKDPSIDIDDMIFASNDGLKSVSIKTTVGEPRQITINPKMQLTGYAGHDTYDIVYPPLGRFRPPIDPISRGVWNATKKVEPLMIFHEIRHCEQMNEDQNLTSGNIKSERDAWRYAFEKIRHLKSEGLDLVPGVTNEEMINRVEGHLLTYDAMYMSKIDGTFSKRVTGVDRMIDEKRDKTKSESRITHSLKAMVAIAKILFDDPTLIKDGMQYKGTPQFTRIPLKTILA